MQELITKFSSNPQGIIVLVVCSMIIVQICLCLWFLSKAKNFIKNAVKTNAKVLDVKLVRVGKTSRTELSIVFKDELGGEVSQVIIAHGAKCNIGDMIEVLYSKNDSTIVKINNFVGLYRNVILTTISLCFLIVGAIIFPFILTAGHQ